MDNYDVEVNSQGNVLLGCVGAFLGAWVGLLPFYAALYFLGYIVFFAPAFTVFGAYLGYRLFCKKMTKSMLITIPAISAVVVIVGVLLGTPVLQLIKEQFPVNAYNIRLFYTVPEVTGPTFRALALGIIGLLLAPTRMRHSIKKGAGLISPDDPMYNITSFGTSVVLTKEIRDKFIESGATSQETALPVDELGLGLKGDSLRTNTYTAMLRKRLIRTKSKKVWYDEKVEQQLRLFVEQN